RRRAGCAGIELLPWAGAVDALADAGMGRLRRRRCACRAADPPPRAFRAALLRPWVRFQWADGRVGVVQLLPPHLGCPDRPARPRLLVRCRTRNRKRRDGARRRSRAAAAARALRETPQGGDRVGLKLAVLAVAVLAAPLSRGVGFLQARQLTDGSFAEQGRTGNPQLTAWAALGLRASGSFPRSRAATAKYLATHESDLVSATD